ncbi:MAG: sigma 54-interacting transcriptional regulator [Myxococcota bacterium]
MSTPGGYTTASMERYDGRRTTSGGPGSHAGLVLLYAPGFRQLQPAYALTDDRILIGREPPADILIAQPAVSRSHAQLVRDAHGWSIRDLGARNGTIVNGVPIHEARLEDADDIRVGDAFFKFVPRDAERYLPYRIDGAVFGAYPTPSGIVGGYQLASIASALERIARSSISVILLGESGTGKEVFARQVHTWSERRGAFRAINCAALPPNLLESELFGYRRGAFSGADRDHVGLVRAADHGTLFLDEVGDMPLEAQAKLLRVLQSKEVLPLGATSPETVDVRILCATHQDLNAMQREGRFRGDLFARLNEYSVTLPPLRARKEDVFALCTEFLRTHKRPDLELSVPYMTGLLHYDFPYNVRELEALIKRGIALAEGGELGASHLSNEIHVHMKTYGRRASGTAAPPRNPIPSVPPPQSAGAPPPSSHPKATGLAAGAHPSARPAPAAAALPSEDDLRRVLHHYRGNVAAVGRHYGKERMQIHRWMKKYDIDPNAYRG